MVIATGHRNSLGFRVWFWIKQFQSTHLTENRLTLLALQMSRHAFQTEVQQNVLLDAKMRPANHHT